MKLTASLPIIYCYAGNILSSRAAFLWLVPEINKLLLGVLNESQDKYIHPNRVRINNSVVNISKEYE